MPDSQLNELGMIEAHTDCPYRDQCDYGKEGLCCHRGNKRVTEFSCTKARLFDVEFQKGELK